MENSSTLSIEHLWRYFQLHSQQRMTVFNFYLVVCGMVAAAIGFSLQQGKEYYYLSSLLSLFLSFISFIFWKLDERVSSMIKLSEVALSKFEKANLNLHYSLFTKDLERSDLSDSYNSLWTYGKCFRCSFLIIGNAGLLMVFVPFLIK